MPRKILHLITDLGSGGAQMMLHQLLKSWRDPSYEHVVVSLVSSGIVAEKIAELNIPVFSLDMSPSRPTPMALAKLVALLKREQPDLMQTWMYHADLLGSTASTIYGASKFKRLPVVWGIHNGTLANGHVKRSTLAIVRILAMMSKGMKGIAPAAVVSCSVSAATVHIDFGYQANRLRTIPNGFDCDAFHPDGLARMKLLAELGLPFDAVMIGNFSRFDHPQKGHRHLVEACGQLREEYPELHLVLAGTNVGEDNELLSDWIVEAGLQDRVHCLGMRSDIPALMAGIDAYCLASPYSEAFPLVIGEALASGTPCVTTNVGDAAWLVGDAGFIVTPGDSTALAQGIRSMLNVAPTNRRAMGLLGRTSIVKNFPAESAALGYASLYANILQ